MYIKLHIFKTHAMDFTYIVIHNANISRILKYNIERQKIDTYVIVRVVFTPNWPNYKA